MDYREMTKKDMELQKKMIGEYSLRLAALPDGRLKGRSRGCEVEYYNVCDKEIYINRSNRKLVEELKLKRYLCTAVERMKNNIRLQQKLLEKYMPYSYGAIEETMPATYKLEHITYGVESCGSGRCAYDRKILDEDVRMGGEYCIHTTSKGLKVRSKSEMLICDLLDLEGVDYEYEKPLKVRIKSGELIYIHPDFTFSNTYGDEFYWEHMGMLGDIQYRTKAIKKIETYIENGIIPSDRLFITGESLDGKLDSGAIMRTIETLQKLLS